MQNVENCETRLSSLFLGPGDHFLAKLWQFRSDRETTESGNLGDQRSTTKFLVRIQPMNSVSLSHGFLRYEGAGRRVTRTTAKAPPEMRFLDQGGLSGSQWKK